MKFSTGHTILKSDYKYVDKHKFDNTISYNKVNILYYFC